MENQNLFSLAESQNAEEITEAKKIYEAMSTEEKTKFQIWMKNEKFAYEPVTLKEAKDNFEYLLTADNPFSGDYKGEKIYEAGKFYDDKGIYVGIENDNHKFKRHDADSKEFPEYGNKYYYERFKKRH